MPIVPDGCKLVLDPRDDHNHAADDVSNYNESMYFSVFDVERRTGGWYRIGNRVNEGYAEMTNCWYLPDGRVAFMASRPKITTNDVMDAGGLRFEILEPFERHRITYEGPICLLENPREMSNPGRAFRENPVVDGRMEIQHTAATACVGGEVVHEDGTPLPIDPDKGFGKAHFDQWNAGRGFLEIGPERFELDGYGARDKTWGPRYWQSIDWYRWLHVYVSPELSLQATVSSDDGGLRTSGHLFAKGEHHVVTEGEIESDWDADTYHSALRFRTTVAGVDYELEGKVRSLIPLRNRRETADGMLVTRITEAMTEYTCNGVPALGMSEYLDQIVDGKPIGADIR